MAELSMRRRLELLSLAVLKISGLCAFNSANQSKLITGIETFPSVISVQCAVVR